MEEDPCQAPGGKVLPLSLALLPGCLDCPAWISPLETHKGSISSLPAHLCQSWLPVKIAVWPQALALSQASWRLLMHLQCALPWALQSLVLLEVPPVSAYCP